jgi:uncharacterized membrane-anchored protein YitT (DUF2179 family)
MVYLSKEKFLSKSWLKSVILVLIGAFIMSAGIVYFISPYKFVPGGVYGISIVLHHLFGLPIGIMALSLDIPLTLLGIKILGPRFGWKTVLGFISLAVFVDLLGYFQGNTPLVEGDPLLSAIFGGVLLGIGLGLVFKSKASSGGTDIVAMILGKYTKMSLGQLIIYVDSVIVLIGLFAFKDWTIPLYSWIIIYITGKVVDLILEGSTFEKSLFIISDKYDEIKTKIIEDIKRSGTLISGTGLYSDNNKQIIFTVVTRRELAMLKEYIQEVDPNAFVAVMNAHEILGNGFKSLDEDN